MRPFAKSTLQEFRAQLIVQRTFWYVAPSKDSYNLLTDGIVQVLRVLAKLGPFELTGVTEELGCARYVHGSSLKGQADVDWTNLQARQRFLAEIVADAEGLLGVVRVTRADLAMDTG